MSEVTKGYHALWQFVHELVESGRLQLTGDEAQWFYTEQPKEAWEGREQKNRIPRAARTPPREGPSVESLRYCPTCERNVIVDEKGDHNSPICGGTYPSMVEALHRKVEELTNELSEARVRLAVRQIVAEEPEKLDGETRMIFLSGKDKPSFRCECGGNCFQKVVGKSVYVCNSCKARYQGE